MLFNPSVLESTRLPEHIFSHTHKTGASMKPYRQLSQIGEFVDADVRSDDKDVRYNIAYIKGAQKWMLVEWEVWDAPGNYTKRDIFLGFTFGYNSMAELLKCNPDLYALGYPLDVWAQECDFYNENRR